MNAKREEEKRAKKEKRTAEVVQLPPPAQRPMKIAYDAVSAVRARRVPEPLYTTSAQFDPDVFRPAKPPPGVVPTNVKPMAMDEDFGSAWGGYGARSENLNWLGYPFLAELAQRSEYRQITETLAKEATRKWISRKKFWQRRGGVVHHAAVQIDAVDRLHPSSGPAWHRADQAEVARGDADDR